MTDATELLARTTLVVHRGPYAIGAWARPQVSAVYQGLLRAQARFSAAVLDDREATAFLPETALIELPPPRSISRGWAVITLDQTLAWDVVGVLSQLTTVLAAAGVPVGSASAFTRDHLFVPGDRLEDALAALGPICGGVRQAE